MNWALITCTTFLALSFIASFLVVKFSLHFDINEWLKSKTEARKQKLHNLCPHMTIEKQGDELKVVSLFVKPVGAQQWVCTQCNGTTYHHDFDAAHKYWTNNIPEFNKSRKAFLKLAKKLG